MRKSSLFQATDLEGCDYNPSPNVVSFSEAQKARAPAHLQHWMSGHVSAPVKKKRWDPLKDGTCAIARIKLKRDAAGNPMLRESKGARWIDAEFILEGRYNNRRIIQRFMLSAKSDHVRNEVAKTRRILEAIFACHAIPAGTGLSAIDGLRVPVELFQYERHGDDKTVNGARVLCPIPGHATSITYEKFGRTRKVALIDEEITLPSGHKKIIQKRWIDYPGWQLYPFTALAKVLQRRLDTFEERLEKNVERAVTKLAGRA